MKAIIAKAKVQSGKEAEFEQVALELAKRVEANEPGNQLYTLCRSGEGDYFFLELYDGPEALAAHAGAPHMKELGPKFMACLDGRPEITLMDVVGD